MSDESPRLSLPFILPAQAQKHVTHNEALERLDFVAQLTVEAFDATEPPDLPEAGQIWALGQGTSGAWAGHDGEIAAWAGDDWLFIAPAPGWRAAQGGDLRLWTGTGWESPTPGDLDDLPGLGVNTGFDTTNRLAVAAPATLLTHEGTDHLLKINKATAGDTASLLFQTGWSGHAEMGTAGNNDFSVKVSPDGATWHDGMMIDRSSGQARFPNGAEIGGALTGAGAASLPALVSDDSDTGTVSVDHTRLVAASQSSRASANLSFVLCSFESEANASGCGVFASAFSKSSASRSAVIGSLECETGATDAFVAASNRVINDVSRSLALGYAASGDASTANRSIHLFGQSGDIDIAGSLNSSANFSDFAEMFPNATGAEIPPGTIVTEENGAVRPAGPGENIAGVVSATAAITAGDTPFHWQGRYLSDEWGRPLFDKIPDPDFTGEGEAPLVRVRRENPDWNPDLPQVKRSERPDQWTRIGILGQVFVRVAEGVQPGDRLSAEGGIGVQSAARTGLRCMTITSAYEAERGYAIARCLINVRV